MKKIVLMISVFLIITLSIVSCGNNDSPNGMANNSTENSVGDSNNNFSSSLNDEITDNSSESSNGGEDGKEDEIPCEHRLGAPVTVKEPTCLEAGVIEQHCQFCDYVFERNVAEKGHEIVVDKGYASTCAKNGLSDGSHCDACGVIIEEQRELPFAASHLSYEFKSMVKEPLIGEGGSAIFACVDCGHEKEEMLSPLTSLVLGKSDIYDIQVSQDNPAMDNKWYIFDGKTQTVGLWNPGNEWFGNVGDTLTITLSSEMMIKDFVMYAAGNWTIASLTVRDTSGKITYVNEQVIANDCAFGGDGEKLTIFQDKSVKAYTIEIKILDNKDNYMGFKVTELEITAAKLDTRMPHTHDYREFVKEVESATCVENGKIEVACFCKAKMLETTPKKEHDYSELLSSTAAGCETDGAIVCKCQCGDTNTVVTKHRGHIYERLKNYITEPTIASGGEGVYLCVTCDKEETRALPPLSLYEIYYLRVDKIENDKVTLKFNIYGSSSTFDIRYSSNEITSKNFDSATKIDADITGEGEITACLNLSVSINNRYYVAVRPVLGDNYGLVKSIRLGGNDVIEIDYNNGRVYHGEVLDSFEKMFDEQSVDFLNGSTTPKTVLPRIFTDGNDKERYGSSLSPIIDLEYVHFISSVYLYYASAGANVSVRWSFAPLDFKSDDSAWSGVYTFVAQKGFNEIKINGEARYIQVIFQDGQAPHEMIVCGYQSGSGDKISEERRPLPTIGEMMGMNGFVAAGNGNTPIDSVSCTTVMREYHNLEWTYTLKLFPGQASFFTGWMGNFDSEYRKYSKAGINVIPCFQWDVKNVSMSYKVDENGYPISSNGEFQRSSFFEKFNPNTYFMYADAMFNFAARYGSNASNTLSAIVENHTQGGARVGLGYITWMELGNEPDGVWNGIDSYLSAYQLAALTSAAYDGHCGTIPVTSTGYHLGIKNADPNMKVAMAGITDIDVGYICSMLHWMRANRSDGKISIDAFNVHKYLSKEITLSNGAVVSVGISPEEGDLVGQLSGLLEMRDKYYADCEVWISEFGWDTNQSYGTEYSAHAYGEYTGRQVQAMWLTRTYLLLSATGVDKAMMFMCEDTGQVEEEAVGKFATSGVIGFEYNKYGTVIEVKKDSYYYLYTLKNTLGNYTFSKQIDAYAENVLIYEYKTDDGKTAYAIWCPTSDGTKYDGYKLKIDGSSATLVEAVYGDTDGVETVKEADEYGYITVDISENPSYILVD